ncbi:Sec-independent protein translocase protein TatB [Permianibacter aggregans]|uniref:Sec-independent protein translocase protein TatB n=1 Tax=Permianibacter aggregans TaxID=1510150 RepID=A0A4R6UZE1_9GAMM|nr:Sec-independent protein translocase protein TatB [Permianibacter aggregans]QGX40111.1 twin-arginine translocase subunit TatB [Permianibacter aggregans]TDQ49074.1 sec-independent protein translocase protein TatB [Permianibacter aggregans]
MFDIGFLELIVIGLVALLVLGPTKLIELARIVGRWVGKLRHQFNDIKADIDRELEVDEMRRRLAEEERKLREEMQVKPVDLNLSPDQEPTIHPPSDSEIKKAETISAENRTTENRNTEAESKPS